MFVFVVVLPESLTLISFLPPLFAEAPNIEPVVFCVVVFVVVLPESLIILRPPLFAVGLYVPAEVSVFCLLVLVAVPPVVAAAVPPELPVELAFLGLLEFFVAVRVLPLALTEVL